MRPVIYLTVSGAHLSNHYEGTNYGASMKILKSLVFFDEGDGNIYKVDTIEYEGGTWLVPGWLESPTLGYKIPERIVQIDCIRHQKTSGSSIADFVLNSPISRAVFDGQKTSLEYVVVERPDIRIPIPKGLH